MLRNTIVLALLFAGGWGIARAGSLDVDVEIPSLDVAEYHKPYLAVWVETDAQRLAAHLAVRYDVEKPNAKGNEWLKDMRQWWRRGGRGLDMPVDGLSAASLAPGLQHFSFDTTTGPLAELTPGQYRLVVEAAREVGGREVVELPFEWPLTATSTEAAGERELGRIVVTGKP